MQVIETSLERLGPVMPATLRPAAADPFEALVAPGDVFRRPHEVLTYPGLSLNEKRGLLASWASDLCAVESCPALRCLPGRKTEPVPVNEVLAALLALDGSPAPVPPPAEPNEPCPFPWRTTPPADAVLN